MTPRMVDVALGYSKGMNAKEIGSLLGLSEGTIRVHSDRLFKHMGVTNKTAVAMRMCPVIDATDAQIKTHYRLPFRVLNVLTELLLGKSNVDIAEELDLDRGTVKNDLDLACRRLGVSGRTNLAILVMNIREPVS